LLISIFLAIAINPMVVFFEKRKMGRSLSATLSMILLFGIVGAILATIIMPLISQSSALLKELPLITTDIVNNPSVHSFVVAHNLQSQIVQLPNDATAFFIGKHVKILAITMSIVNFLSALVVVFVLTFVLLLEGEELASQTIKLLVPTHRKRVTAASKKISKVVSGFISGNLFISLIAGIVTAITLLALRIPYVFALSALVALFDLIPLVGAALGTIIIGFVALTKGLLVAVTAVGVLILYQFIEAHFIQPVVYSRTIDLSPLFIILVSIIGAEVAGIGGVILAIPLAAILEIVGQELYFIFKTGR
jgi:predicted PurR-regulated permease PerM